MSRSYRKPASAITGTGSAKDDKRHAARGVRRKQDQWLRVLMKEPLESIEGSALAPHKLECAWNDTYNWGRDGSQRLQYPSQKQWSKYCRLSHGLYEDEWERRWYERNPEQLARDLTWPPVWFQKLTRK